MAGRVMLIGLLLFLEKHNAGMPSHVEVLCVKYNQSGFLGCKACMHVAAVGPSTMPDGFVVAYVQSYSLFAC